MNQEIFININKIIERDSKVTTYKFALLRGVIDIIQDNSPYIKIIRDDVHIPLGLLIEKWLLYYYPILDSEITIPQNFGTGNLAFRTLFLKVITFYKDKGGYSSFYNDLRKNGIPKEIENEFLQLANKLKDTIVRQPMKYAGRSFNSNFYPIFSYQRNTNNLPPAKIDISFLISRFGSFSIPVEYYEGFKLIGSFINGFDSILFKWAEFSVNASRNILSFEKAINEIIKSPITKRDVDESKGLYNNELKIKGNVTCVWTGNAITKFDVDHVIPFSIWKNNDLWNLLPSDPITNNSKRDKIPAIGIMEKQKDLIIYYWDLIREKQEERFRKEIQISLLGIAATGNWQNAAFERLKDSCNYLIANRGFEEWKI